MLDPRIVLAVGYIALSFGVGVFYGAIARLYREQGYAVNTALHLDRELRKALKLEPFNGPEPDPQHPGEPPRQERG